MFRFSFKYYMLIFFFFCSSVKDFFKIIIYLYGNFVLIIGLLVINIFKVNNFSCIFFFFDNGMEEFGIKVIFLKLVNFVIFF